MASDLLKGVTVKVQPRSGFDKSRKNILTTKVGTLTPILTDLVIPNSDVSIKMAISAQLPPLASDTFMRCSLKVEGFFCPLRLLYGGFESWLTGYEMYSVTNASTYSAFRAELPRLEVSYSDIAAGYVGAGTLLDYLGVHMDDAWTADQTTKYYLNVLPLLAYHRIFDDWYRNTKIQTPVFIHPGELATGIINGDYTRMRTCPFDSFKSIYDFKLSNPFMDGVRLGELRQRNFGVDYFTSATPTAQKGSPMTVGVSGNAFSISALRSANSIQQWEELQNLSGARIQDYVLANYGAHLSGGIAQRAIYLGSADYPIYSKGIYATADPGQATAAQGTNPFDTVGTKYGSAYASGSDFVLKGHFDEPGILMVLVSLVPEVNYSTGVSPLMMRFTASGSQVDLPSPMLQNVGNEPIATSELDTYAGVRAADPGTAGTVFGYVPRYTWIKTGVNEIHGLLLDGQSLESFVAQRSFGVGTPSINTNFLQIPTNFLDQVTVVNAALSNYGVWIDSFIQYYVSMPLSQYSVPSLQNPAYEHGVSVHLQNNGSKID